MNLAIIPISYHIEYAFIMAILFFQLDVIPAWADEIPLCSTAPKEEQDVLLSNFAHIDECN